MYNHYYAAVHEAAFEIKPDQQRMRFALEDYANSLPKYTAGKAYCNKIVKRNSFVQNSTGCHGSCHKDRPRVKAGRGDEEQKKCHSSTIDTTINATVNKVDDWDVNYVAAKQNDGRFNSTMKPGHRRDSNEYSS